MQSNNDGSIGGFQSTRPRGARMQTAKIEGIAGVSIHAPTRGANVLAVRLLLFLGFNPRAHAGREQGNWDKIIEHIVSIHAPTRGAKYATKPACDQASFNPRAHAGREYNCPTLPMSESVSIHAPTRGAKK